MRAYYLERKSICKLVFLYWLFVTSLMEEKCGKTIKVSENLVLKIFSSYDVILSSNPSSPRNRRIFRHDVIDHDDTVFLPTPNSRRSSSRMSTESEEMERRKLIRPKLRRCSEGVTTSTRSPTYGIVNRINKILLTICTMVLQYNLTIQ
jgi:hypothetical protein